MRYLILLLIFLMVSTGCSTLTETAENSRDATREVKEIAEKVNKRINEIDIKLDNVKDSVKKEIANAIDPIDTDRDGQVDIPEIARYAQDNRDRWGDLEFWTQLVLALVGSWLGIKGVGKVGKPVIAKIHKTGREELAKRGERSQNE